MSSDGLRFVAAVSCDPHEDREQLMGNAHLIAASPALYEALEICRDMLVDMFRTGFAHTGEGGNYGSYYVGEGVLPTVSTALALARGEQTGGAA